MDPIGFILILVVVVIIAAVGAYFVHLAAKKRREKLAALATELAFEFDRSQDRSHDEQYSHFEIFRRGHSRAAYNTLTGSLTIDDRGYPVRMRSSADDSR